MQVDCEPSLYFAISGPGMADSSVWSCDLLQVGELGESSRLAVARGFAGTRCHRSFFTDILV